MTRAVSRLKAIAPNQVWSLDFVVDQLADRRRFRALTVVEVFTRESLVIELGHSLKGELAQFAAATSLEGISMLKKGVGTSLKGLYVLSAFARRLKASGSPRFG